MFHCTLCYRYSSQWFIEWCVESISGSALLMNNDYLSILVSPGQVMPLDEVLLRRVSVTLLMSHIGTQATQKSHWLKVRLYGSAAALVA